MKSEFDGRWFFDEAETAAEQMRRLLVECRRQAMEFPAAWARSMSRIRFTSTRDQQQWLATWDEPEVFAAWWAGYDRQPHYGSASVAVLAEMHEAVGYRDALAVEPFVAHREIAQ